MVHLLTGKFRQHRTNVYRQGKTSPSCSWRPRHRWLEAKLRICCFALTVLLLSVKDAMGLSAAQCQTRTCESKTCVTRGAYFLQWPIARVAAHPVASRFRGG